MSAWLSKLSLNLPNLPSLTSLRGNPEADGDTEDDTLVCRTLRNYYDRLPEWLPPDPNASPPVQVALTKTGSSSIASTGQRDGRSGRMNGEYGNGGGASGSEGTENLANKLSSLWGDSNSSSGGSDRGRNGAQTLQRPGLGGNPRSSSYDRRGVRQDNGGGVVPLPSQRAGSYQNQSQNPNSAQSISKLVKERYNRTASPRNGNPFAPPRE